MNTAPSQLTSLPANQALRLAVDSWAEKFGTMPPPPVDTAVRTVMGYLNERVRLPALVRIKEQLNQIAFADQQLQSAVLAALLLVDAAISMGEGGLARTYELVEAFFRV